MDMHRRVVDKRAIRLSAFQPGRGFPGAAAAGGSSVSRFSSTVDRFLTSLADLRPSAETQATV